MSDLPVDLDKIIETADRELQAEGVPPHARPIHAVMKVGSALTLPRLPLIPLNEHDPEKDSFLDLITQRISSWYRELYGDRLKFDPSANARVAIIADGDVWEGNLPIIFGGLVAPSRKLPDTKARGQNAPEIYNPCAHLTGITQARLDRFTHADINEVVELYNLGHNARDAFKRFREYNPLFVRAEADWAAATLHLTAQRPDYGQSLYSSYQVIEKFMKGLYAVITHEKAPHVHGLDGLFKELKTKCQIRGLDDLEPLLKKIPYNGAFAGRAANGTSPSFRPYFSPQIETLQRTARKSACRSFLHPVHRASSDAAIAATARSTSASGSSSSRNQAADNPVHASIHCSKR